MSTARRYYSSVVEIARDRGLIGKVLRKYQWMLPAADKWAEQNADYQEKHEYPNRLPFPAPWQFLLDVTAVAERDKSVFRAAQSQLAAWLRLLHMAQGFATVKTDWHQEALKACVKGDKHRENHAAGKLADAMLQYELVQADVRKHAKDSPELLPQMEHWQKNRRAQLVHHGHRREAEQVKELPQWNEFRAAHRAECMLVEWWVRCGEDGTPGLMFWRNAALTKLLNTLRGGTSSTLDSPGSLKKKRQNLGLIPVSDNQPWVWMVTVQRDNATDWKISGTQRDGSEAFTFTGKLLFNGQLILPLKDAAKGPKVVPG